MIRDFKEDDIEQLLSIYNYYVVNTVATFDIHPISLKTYSEKINGIAKEFPVLVYVEDSIILGFAYGSKWRPKPAYKNTVESTVYVKHNAHGKGIGTQLYNKLFKQLKEQNYRTVVGGLTVPNEVSVKLHERFGFKKVAHFKGVGYKFNQWLDVAFYQLEL